MGRGRDRDRTMMDRCQSRDGNIPLTTNEPFGRHHAARDTGKVHVLWKQTTNKRHGDKRQNTTPKTNNDKSIEACTNTNTTEKCDRSLVLPFTGGGCRRVFNDQQNHYATAHQLH